MRTLRLALVCSVLLHHALRGGFAAAAGAPAADRFWAWCSRWLAESGAGIRIPLLFLTAGYLLFRHGPLPAGAWRGVWRRRLRSLALPMLLWSALAGAGLWAAQSWPPTAAAFSGAWPRWADAHGAWGVLDLWLGVTRFPMIYPLWFLRDLLLLVALAPLWQALVQRTPRWLPPLALALLAALWWFGSDSQRPLSHDGPFFFPLGAWLGLRQGGGRGLRAIDRAGPWLLAGVLPLSLWRAGWVDGVFPWPADRLYALAAMAMLLWLGGRLAAREAAGAPPSRGVDGLSFVLFLTHEPLLSLMRRPAAWLLGRSATPAAHLGTSLLAAGLTLALVAAGWHLLRHRAPRLLRVVSGGRGLPPGR